MSNHSTGDVHTAPCAIPGRADQQRHPHGSIEKIGLVDQPGVPIHLSVVRYKDDNSIVQFAASLNGLQDLTNLRIDQARIARVVSAHSTNVSVRQSRVMS